MITVSGLRYDALTSEKMPKLFEFATSSTQFTNHYSSGNTNNAGLVGLFYGLNANYTDSILSNHTPSVLIKKLQDEKYQFVAYSSTAFKDSLFKQALFRNVKLPKVKAFSPKEAINGILSLLKEDKPWFAYVDLDIADQTEENYTKSLADIDQQIDDTLASVSLDNTIVIITAEHGTTFNKLDEKARENYFGRDEIQVPFIVYWKDLPVQEVSKLTSHTDLLPALMSSIFKVKIQFLIMHKAAIYLSLMAILGCWHRISVGMSLFSRMAHSIILIVKETIRNLIALILSNLQVAHHSACS